jgi:hypothetical protein
MNKFTIELIASNKVLKHALMFDGKCVCCFSNKRHAMRILNFLKWHEKRFGEFTSIEECGFQIHHSISNANLAIRYETIY